MKEELLLDVLREERMKYALERALIDCREYQDAEDALEEELETFMKTGLSEEQESLFDEVCSAYNDSASEYGRAAYRQGLNDGMKLVYEIWETTRGESVEKDGDMENDEAGESRK